VSRIAELVDRRAVPDGSSEGRTGDTNVMRLLHRPMSRYGLLPGQLFEDEPVPGEIFDYQLADSVRRRVDGLDVVRQGIQHVDIGLPDRPERDRLSVQQLASRPRASIVFSSSRER